MNDDTNTNTDELTTQIQEADQTPTQETTEEAVQSETEAHVQDDLNAQEESATAADTQDSADQTEKTAESDNAESETTDETSTADRLINSSDDNPNARWYVVHTYSGHENKVATALKQRVESEHLDHKILDVLVPTQEKIEIRGGKKGTVKEKIFPGYILVKMELDDNTWLAVRTTQGVTAFVGMGNKPTPIPDSEVKSIVRFMTQGAAPTFKDVFMVDDTVKITDGPFNDFIGKIDSVDKEHGKVRVLVSIFGRETPVELDFLQVQKL